MLDVMTFVVVVEEEDDAAGGVVEHFLSLPHVRPGQQPVTVVAVGPR